MIGLVLDTNVIVSGLLWSGKPADLLDTAFEGRARLFTSHPILDELLDVLHRRKMARRLSELGCDPVTLAIDYAAQCTIVEPQPIARTAPDPDDDEIIATALSAGADLIVTGDAPLLSVKACGAVEIVRVAEALVRVQSG